MRFPRFTSSFAPPALLRFAALGAFLFAVLPVSGCAPKNRPENVAEADVNIALPPSGGFTFGAGDSLRVTVWRHEDLTMELTVAPDGAISFPLVGRLQIAGMTYDEVVKVMQEGIGKYYVDAQVAVNITAVTNQKVLILGEVPNPMVLQITNDLSILEAIVRAGGISQDAHTSNVLLIRGGLEKPKLYTVNVDAIFRQGDLEQMVYLQRGDIVVVPPKTITNVQRFFQRISSIIGPAVSGSTIYRNVLYGTSVGGGS